MGPQDGLSKDKAQRKALRFEEEVERLLKRYEPRDYSSKIAEFIFSKLSDPGLWTKFPIHYLLHSIEANCAYHRGHSEDLLNGKQLIHIASFYGNHIDPYVQYTFEERNLMLAVLALGCQQFESQREPEMAYFARYFFLFVENNPSTEVEALFIEKYGFTIHDWMYMSFAVLAYTIGQKRQLVTVDSFLDSEIESIPRHAVEPFLKASNLTINQVGDRYKETRKKEPSHLYIFIPSIFYEYPLIDFEDGNYLVIHPYMLLHHASEKLYKLCAELDEVDFLQRFGGSFQNYVGRVLAEIPGTVGIYPETELQKVSPGKSCDYAVELKDCILLIECKAVRYSSKFMTEPAVAKDNSTGKIADAFEQILAVAERIRADKQLKRLFEDCEKPLYGFCVTFGEFQSSNFPDYVNLIIRQMPKQITSREKWFAPLEKRPQTVSVETLEQFVRVMQQVNKSAKVMIEEKGEDDGVIFAGNGRLVVENWRAYLLQYFPGVGTWVLPFLDEAANRFFTQVFGHTPPWPQI